MAETAYAVEVRVEGLDSPVSCSQRGGPTEVQTHLVGFLLNHWRNAAYRCLDQINMVFFGGDRLAFALTDVFAPGRCGGSEARTGRGGEGCCETESTTDHGRGTKMGPPKVWLLYFLFGGGAVLGATVEG